MCGRFAQVIKHDELQKLARELKLREASEQIELNYNVAPTQTVAAALSQPAGNYIGFFRWGLIASWSKEIPKFQLINARAETLMEKPTFRSGLQRRRCIIPANGFYEWRQSDKQPFYIHPSDGDLLYLAGIYDSWYAPDGSNIPSLAIITTAANGFMSVIHQRMPVLLFGADREAWLDHQNTDTSSLQRYLLPAAETALAMHPVSKAVNKVSYNNPDCLTETAG